MAIDNQLKKQNSITAIYSTDTNSSAIKKPFNLNVVYDPSAGSGPQYLGVTGFDSLSLGDIKTTYKQNIIGIGIDSAKFGTSLEVKNLKQIINIQNQGIESSNFGNQEILNKNKTIQALGFDSQFFNNSTYIFNLKQYISAIGFDAQTFGSAYFQGGVKYVYTLSFDSQQFGLTNVVNTKADQFIFGTGIAAPDITPPVVSPRFLNPTGIRSENFGQPVIQRSPCPNGFDTSSYGVAWVSHSPRYIQPTKVEAFISGYPKVFDPTQKIYVTGANTVITGGVFGDISAKNTRRIITVSGLYSQSFSDWSIVESNLRNIIHSGFDAQSFGSNAIQNKTPSIAPIGINSFDGLSSAIGYRIRTLKPSGWYQPKFGTHTLTKPPEIKPVGIYQNDFGAAWISNKTRSIYAGLGRESLLFGEINVWHFTRRLKPTGIFKDGYGTPRVEHGRRTILANGSVHSAYGNGAWVSYAVRQLSPSSITYPNIPNHRVGGTQRINVFGYVATLFGSRIIPESQSIYPQGFINPFGISAIDLWKKYIKPNGFLTTGQEGGHRFGTHKFWNLRQYIVQFYDGDSGLAPPKWTGWTSIENRNKTIGAIGSNFARVAEPYIENKARLLLPFGIDAQSFGKPMIADRIRYLKLQGLESPYFSGWSAIYNAAPVIVPHGVNTQVFGIGGVINTRRYFNRIGNFESLLMGIPMIAPRVRTLSFEHRYTIAPPIIPLPIVDLYTRYIEEVGRFDDHQAFGLPLLNIRWNRITTRWTHRDYFGYPILKNLTPELKQRGHNNEEFGNAFLRAQWRELLQQGSETVLWGRSEIAFRDRQFSVNGFTQWAIPTHKVTKTGVPPYYPQYIWLDAVEIDGEQNGGHGITMPDGQVPHPLIKTNVVSVSGFNATRYGEDHYIQSNGIMMEYGISMPLFEQGPLVTLKNRTISVEKGIDSTITVGTPRFTPHTIYAVMEAPTQAKQNHPSSNLHYVNSDGGYRTPGEVFGQTRVTLKHRVLQNLGIGNLSGYGTPQIQLKRRYIDVKGLQSYRMGWHNIGDGTQEIKSQPNNLFTVFGNPGIALAKEKNVQLRITGINASLYGRPVVEFFNRTIKPSGYNTLAMGSSRGDTLYMPQSLHVGPRRPTIPVGTLMEKFGTTYIGLKVRDIQVQGFIATVIGYDPKQFKERMRIERGQGGAVIPAQTIKPVGFDALLSNASIVKYAVHYIRPDGNSDQFRKGAF